MKNLILLISGLFLLAFEAKAGELNIIPDKPVGNSSVNFVYTPGSQFSPDSRLTAYVYAFNSGEALPHLYLAPLSFSKQSKSFSGSFLVPDNAVYAMVKVGNDSLMDKNGGNFWDFFVTGSNGAIKKGANKTAAMTYLGSSPDSYLRNVDFAKALDYLQKENQLFPDDISTEIALYSLQFDTKKINKTEFENKIRNLVQDTLSISDENLLLTITRALRAINMNDKADMLENNFVASHPSSRIAEDRRFSGLGKARTFRDFSDKILAFIHDFPESSQKDKVYPALVSGFAQKYTYNKLLNLLDSLGNAPSSAYLGLAWEVMNHDKILRDSSEEFRAKEVNRLISLAIDKSNLDNPGLKASYLTDEEWNRIKSVRKASVYESVGDVYIKLNSLDSAAKYYLSALQSSIGNSQPELYAKLLDIYERQGKYNDALRVSEHSIIYSESNPDVLASNKKSYVKVKGSDQGYDDYIAALQKQAKDRRLQKLGSNMLDITPELGYIETVDGLSVDMRAFKGNVIVLEFWSTWCEPCEQQVKALDSLREKYSTRQDVVFLPVDVWENVSNKSQEIKSFVKETGIQLPVYTDPKDILPQKFGVTGLPTTILIDKGGKIRFKESGFDNDATVIRDIDDRLELLLNEKL